MIYTILWSDITKEIDFQKLHPDLWYDFRKWKIRFGNTRHGNGWTGHIVSRQDWNAGLKLHKEGNLTLEIVKNYRFYHAEAALELEN